MQRVQSRLEPRDTFGLTVRFCACDQILRGVEKGLFHFARHLVPKFNELRVVFGLRERGEQSHHLHRGNFVAVFAQKFFVRGAQFGVVFQRGGKSFGVVDACRVEARLKFGRQGERGVFIHLNFFLQRKGANYKFAVQYLYQVGQITNLRYCITKRCVCARGGGGEYNSRQQGRETCLRMLDYDLMISRI